MKGVGFNDDDRCLDEYNYFMSNLSREVTQVLPVLALDMQALNFL